MLKPWQRRPQLGATPQPQHLDPLTLARKTLLKEMVEALLPPEFATLASPMLSQALNNLDAQRAQATVNLIYDVANKFKALDDQHVIKALTTL
jgi:hypothetical protein